MRDVVFVENCSSCFTGRPCHLYSIVKVLLIDWQSWFLVLYWLSRGHCHTLYFQCFLEWHWLAHQSEFCSRCWSHWYWVWLTSQPILLSNYVDFLCVVFNFIWNIKKRDQWRSCLHFKFLLLLLVVCFGYLDTLKICWWTFKCLKCSFLWQLLLV